MTTTNLILQLSEMHGVLSPTWLQQSGHRTGQADLLQVQPGHRTGQADLLQVRPGHRARQADQLQVQPGHRARQADLLEVQPDHWARQAGLLQVQPSFSQENIFLLKHATLSRHTCGMVQLSFWSYLEGIPSLILLSGFVARSWSVHSIMQVFLRHKQGNEMYWEEIFLPFIHLPCLNISFRNQIWVWAMYVLSHIPIYVLLINYLQEKKCFNFSIFEHQYHYTSFF